MTHPTTPGQCASKVRNFHINNDALVHQLTTFMDHVRINIRCTSKRRTIKMAATSDLIYSNVLLLWIILNYFAIMFPTITFNNYSHLQKKTNLSAIAREISYDRINKPPDFITSIIGREWSVKMSSDVRQNMVMVRNFLFRNVTSINLYVRRKYVLCYCKAVL